MTRMIFVYGSLMTGYWNHNEILKGHVVHAERGYVKGTLYHLTNKGYPGFVQEGDHRVYGEILSVTEFHQVREYMDTLEGCTGVFSHQTEYNRIQTEVTSCKSGSNFELDVYVYNPDAPVSAGDHRFVIKDGDWRRYMTLNQPLSPITDTGITAI